MNTVLRLLVLSLLVPGASALAQADGGTPLAESPEVAPAASPAPTEAPSNETMIQVLASELRRLKEEISLPASSYQSYSGLGPAASKVYFTPKGLSLGGYAQASYSFHPQGDEPTGTDLERVVLYVGYRFTERIVFNSEIEFEHASTEHGGSVNVEFAYLDFKLFDALSARVGNVLVPMGFINEIHEPPFYFGVHRPTVEHDIIPATWNENGLGLYGEYKGLRYRAYLINGMHALTSSKVEGFDASSWVREGRQGGAGAIAANFAGVASVDYTVSALRVGASAYYGRSGQGQAVDGTVINGDLFLGEAHAAFQWKGLWVRGLIAYGSLGDSDRISSANGSIVGKESLGGYAEVAYDVLGALLDGTEQSLSPFVRYESLDTHKSVAPGLARDPAQARQIVTAGLHYRPISNVVLKADYQHVFPNAGGSSSTVNLGVGLVF